MTTMDDATTPEVPAPLDVAMALRDELDGHDDDPPGPATPARVLARKILGRAMAGDMDAVELMFDLDDEIGDEDDSSV